MTIVTKEFSAKETICGSCAEVIKRAAMKVDGVTEASFDYAKERGSVTYDVSKTSIDDVFKKIEEKGYPCTLIEEKIPDVTPSETSLPTENQKSRKSKKGKVCEPDCDCVSEENEEAAEDMESDDDIEISLKSENDIKTNHFGHNDMFAFGIIGLGLLVLAYFMLPVIGGLEIPQFNSTMGYSLLFVAGLLTGFHCISMCGSFVVSYTAKDAQAGVRSKRSHLLYGAGKTISYTVIGGIFGLVGSIVAFTPAMRGAAAIIAGIFLVLYGLKMLNVHPIFRRLTIRTPRFIAKFVHKEEKQHSNPLLIGLLNGLMIACGPLQAMYIMAAGTGSPIQGATLLLVFGLGTLPAMLGFGYFASAISSKMTHKILKVSGVVVAILGIFMLNNGLALTGSGYDFSTISASVFGAGIPAAAQGSGGTIAVANGYQTIVMNVTSAGWSPSQFVLKKGVPVKWVINGIQLNSCNSGVQVPQLNMKFQIKQGEQTIEFTPTQEGIIPFSCWMGMIQGRFIVKADIDTSNQTAVSQAISAAPAKAAGGTCSMGSGGSCGCMG